MPLEVIITQDDEQMSQVAADILIPAMAAATLHEQREFNLGLATGSSPLVLYNLMVQRQREFDARKVKTWNLDEYVGIGPEHPESYHYYMKHNLFDRLNPRFRASRIPKGHELNEADLESALLEESSTGNPNFNLWGENSGKSIVVHPECAHSYLRRLKDELLAGYLASITEGGGIDWQIAGVGRNGHIGFHESGIPLQQRMMLVSLAEETRTDSTTDGHFSQGDAPKYALTLGAGAMIDYRYVKNIIVLASGSRKTEPTARSLLKPISVDVPLSSLQDFITRGGYSRAVYVIDMVVAAGIIRHEEELKHKGIAVKDLRKEPLMLARH